MNARQLFVLGASMLAAALATPSLSRQERHGAPLIARNARDCKRAPPRGCVDVLCRAILEPWMQSMKRASQQSSG
jgi:hypothetical protein